MVHADRSMYDIDIMVLLGCCLLPKGVRAFERHTHDAYEFHHVVGGSGSFEVGGKWRPIRAGDFFYTRPRTEHRAVVPSDGDYLLQYVVFLVLDTALDVQVADDLMARLPEGVPHRAGDRLHGFFAQLSRLSEAGDAYQSRAAAFRFVALLYELMAGSQTSHHGHPAIEKALEYMRSQIGEAYTLDDLATRLGLEKSYFIRLFKKNVGVSPMNYAMNLKMSAAADLLCTTREPLALVAAQVGFPDEYHFAKRFKQWSGLAPGTYRGRG